MRLHAPRGRIRVLSLIKGLGPGGAERLLVTAAAVRDRQRFDYQVAYLLPWKQTLVSELESSGVGVRCLDVHREWDLRWAGRLRYLLVETPVDILHVHSPYAAGVARLVVRTLPRRARPHIVSTEHNDWSRLNPATRVINGVTLPLSNAVITVSDEVRESIWRPFRRRAETVIHGVVIDEIRALRAERPVVRHELGPAPEELLVATIANFTPKKDYPNLLRAARHLVNRGVPVRFLVIGQGPLARDIEALRDELDLRERVTIMGYRKDATRLLAGCDLFVLASRFEGLPVSIMEALVLGLPVVATDVGGVPEAVRDGREGLLVAPGRPDLLADAIEQVVTDVDVRERMATAATERGEYFDIVRAVRRCEAIYDELASQ